MYKLYAVFMRTAWCFLSGSEYGILDGTYAA